MMKKRKPIICAAAVFSVCLMLPDDSAAYKPLQNDDLWIHPGHVRNEYRRYIAIPDLDGYLTLKCDLHTHTSFSDGQVYPTGRVSEAWCDGLDVIAITDHIEVRNFPGVMHEDLDLSNQIAKKEGDRIGMMVISGVEITRKKPFGHMNAIFLRDANALRKDDPLVVLEEALSQGAYITWNHPGWPDDDCRMYPVHERLLKEGKIHAIEIFNRTETYPRVYQWYEQYDFSMIAATDIHHMSGHLYPGWLRPMTLVFATEYTEESVKEALFEGRVLALFDNTLAGSEEYMREMVEKSIRVKVIDEKKGLVELCNTSDITYSIRYGDYMFGVPIYGHTTARLTIPKGTEVTFKNCVTGYDKFMSMQLW